MSFYPEVNPNPDFPAIEEKILAFWERERIFERSVDNRKGAKEFIFYDGPPFANGLPHYGHLLTGYVKDLFARYQTMKGKHAPRRFGWDCHGLPAEMGAEKELGISGRQAIMKYGIGKFNDHCRQSVMKYTQEWQDYVTRQARWVDFKNDYKTMNVGFMESVLWAFKQLYDKGLVYEAYRVMPYSWAAETPLSNFETRLDNSYREREDKAVTVAFELNTPPHGAPKASKYYVLAWTTTPWTLPSNLALAVNKEVEYVYCGKDGEPSSCYIVGAKARFGLESLGFYPYTTKPIPSEDIKGKLYDGPLVMRFTGADLLGLSYHPLFPYFSAHHHAFKILDGSSFVTDADGTGIVHMAPGFGEDDQRVCEANGIELVCPVDGEGKFTDAIYDLTSPSPLEGEGGMGGKPQTHEQVGTPHPNPPPQGGRELKLKDLNVIAENVSTFKFGEANERIIQWLKNHGQLIKQETIKHNYPHCWRTDQPLIYRAISSWYVEVTKFRDRMVELNRQINWIPAHIRDGLFGKWLEGARDWSISRNRFWGTPIPVWRSDNPENKELYVFGSIAELNAFFGSDIKDLHRPFIDELTKPDPHDAQYTIRRVEDVFDCWFESGSMPYASQNAMKKPDRYPADFIVEYSAQTRGWFYTMMVLGTALFDEAPFKNCICHGVVLDDKGQKLSKRLNNYADPTEIFDKFGADALRWFMMSSPVMRGDELYIDKEGKFIRDVVRLAIKPIWNAYNFFCLYANADGVKAKIATDSKDVMDRYILAKCKQAVEIIEKAFDNYDTPTATEAVSQFFEALNNWYIRRNKERFWSENKEADPASPNGFAGHSKQAAYDTLYTVLTTMCRAAAPLLPLTCEEIYKGLTGEESVHLMDFPSVIPAKAGIYSRMDPRLRGDDDTELMAQMDFIRDVCNAALAIRNKLNIRVRQPLNEITIVANSDKLNTTINGNNWHLLWTIVRDEVNVKKQRGNLTIPITDYASYKLSLNNPVLGKRLPEKMKQIIPASKKGEWKQVDGGVEICGEKLLPSEYTLQLEPKPEYKDRAQALSTNDALVILDTIVTPELEAEGIARDMVRMIQQARKDANFNVSDRIRLHVGAPDVISKAMQTHKNYIMEQTLAVEFSSQKPEKPAFTAENTLDDQKVVISLSLAA